MKGLTELKGDLRVGDAAELRAALADALAQGDALVATAGVTSLDCAIVQVLVSARRTAARMERKLQIEMPDGGALTKLRDRLALGAVLEGEAEAA